MYLKKTIALLSFIIAFCLIGKCPRQGLEYIALIPFSYGIVVWKWGDIFVMKKGVGISLFLFISILRYLLQPILLVLSSGELNFRMPNANASSYNIAIIIYILECIISFYTINKFYRIETDKAVSLRSFPNLTSYNINILGWLCTFIFSFVLFYRVGTWYPELKILGIKEGGNVGMVLDATLFNVLKGFFFIFILYKAKQTRSHFIIVLAIILGLFNFMSYFGQNRSFIFETAISTIFLFTQSYPKYKKRILMFFIPFAVAIIGYMYVNKQFGMEDANDYKLIQENGITEYSNILEEYVNGLWTVARSYQASIGLPFELSISALFKDVIDGLQSLRDLPILKTELFPITDYLLSSSDIFKLSLRTDFEYAQMLSFSGGMFIIGGTILGWPLMIFANYFMVRLLVRVDARSVFCKNLYYKYIYIWMSCLLSLLHCYCLQTIIHCWTKYILFFWIILYINNKKRIKANPI